MQVLNKILRIQNQILLQVRNPILDKMEVMNPSRTLVHEMNPMEVILEQMEVNVKMVKLIDKLFKETSNRNKKWSKRKKIM